MARRGNYLAAATLMGWIIMHASQPANANAPSTFEPDVVGDVPVFGVHEIALTSEQSHTNPYTDVSLSATFTGPSAQTLTIPGFWDGAGTWRLRIAPTEAGTWTLTTVSTADDTDLNGQGEGTTFVARSPTAADISANEVVRHGFTRISPTHPHAFEHADGTSFFPLGDTQWERMALSTDGLTISAGNFQTYQNDRAGKGFNVAVVSTLAAHSQAFGNEGGDPFTTGISTQDLNPAFFQDLDDRIAYANSVGIIPMLMIGSPDGGLTTDTTILARLQKYLCSRYSAYDVWWCPFKEYTEFAGGGVTQADAAGNAITANDPYGHPTTMHPGSGSGGTSALDAKAYMDFHSVQGRDTGTHYSLGKPVVITEAWYEYETSTGELWDFSDADLYGTSGIWPHAFNGTWNCGYQFVAEPRGDTTAIFANMNTTAIQLHGHLRTFFLACDYRALVPRADLIVASVGSMKFMAQETNENGTATGDEYAAWLPAGGTLTVDLSAATGTLSLDWFSPTAGAFSNQTTVTAGASVALVAPDSNAWAARIYP